MDQKIIYGIQQIGVGVKDADQAFEWYATRLGADVSVFDDNNTATHMAQYMGGSPRPKRAILAVNLHGGAGYELWQYTKREPSPPVRPVLIGDYGINIAKVKAISVERSFQKLKDLEVQILGPIANDPDGRPTFYIEDPYHNIIQIKEFDSWYSRQSNHTGGVYGGVIGVSDIEASLKLYSEILGYNEVIYDETGTFDDYQGLPGGKEQIRRVLLGHRDQRIGGFSPLFGASQIELVQVLSRDAHKIYQDRYWGDLGFIHICFDVRNLPAIVKECKEKGFPFTVLSEESFDMGDANGHWGYLEDLDGTLIEFVETKKVPILKALNLNINLKNRDPHKPLPNWIINAMSMKRVKF